MTIPESQGNSRHCSRSLKMHARTDSALALFEIIENARENGQRMLIFSQFPSMLRIIRDRLEASGRSSYYLDGQTPGAERVRLVEAFNSGAEDIFLISLKAGGTGLNLTGADTDRKSVV